MVGNTSPAIGQFDSMLQSSKLWLFNMFPHSEGVSVSIDSGSIHTRHNKLQSNI